jgi:hypothetical protein
VLFSAGLWVILVGLIFGGLPPITIATALSISVMLAVVVNLRAGLVFSLSYMLAWLLYIGLGSAQLAPVPYFTGSALTSWFLAVASVWLVLLPIPELIRKLRASASLQHAVIEATTDGILVVNQLGKVEIFNQRFIEIWGIDPELRRTLDDGVLLNLSSNNCFIRRIFCKKFRSCMPTLIAPALTCCTSRMAELWNAIPSRSAWMSRSWGGSGVFGTSRPASRRRSPCVKVMNSSRPF